MAKILQFRRMNASQAAAHTGSEGELIVEQGANTLRVHDGLSLGGTRLLTEDAAEDTYATLASVDVIQSDLQDDITALSAAASAAIAAEAVLARNATNLTSGTIPDARFPSTLPAMVGTALTALNATNLTTGTIPDARFPATLPALVGTALTALNATNLSTGTIPNGRFPATLPAASAANLTAIPGGQITGALAAVSGAALTSLTPANITGQVAIAQGGSGAATAAGARTAFGLVIGTNVQAYNDLLLQIANLLGVAVDNMFYTNGSNSITTTALTAYGRSLIDDADAATARTTLGLGTMAGHNASAVAITGGTITGITDLTVADGGTGASTAANARTNLGLGAIAVLNTIATGNIDLLGITTGLLAANAVTDAKFRQGAALSLVGVTGNATANVADIAAATDGQVMRRSGTAIAFGAVNLAVAAATTGYLPVDRGGRGGISGSKTGMADNAATDVFTITVPAEADLSKVIFKLRGYSETESSPLSPTTVRGYAGEYAEWVVVWNGISGTWDEASNARVLQQQHSINAGILTVAATLTSAIAGGVITFTITVDISGSGAGSVTSAFSYILEMMPNMTLTSIAAL